MDILDQCVKSCGVGVWNSLWKGTVQTHVLGTQFHGFENLEPQVLNSPHPKRESRTTNYHTMGANAEQLPPVNLSIKQRQMDH